MPATRVNKLVSKNAVYIDSKKKIFVVGFNKCGTRSFTDLFERSGIGCVHWDNNMLASNILKDIKESGSINLDNYYPESNAFTDIIYVNTSNDDDNILIVEIIEIIEEIARNYPDAYYIINTRNIEDWLRSRFNHERGNFAANYKNFLYNKYNIRYSDYMLAEYWRYIWHRHHYHLLRKFRKSNNFKYLFYDIERSSFSDLIRFLEPDYSLKGRSFPVKGKSSYDNNYIRMIISNILKGFKSFIKSYL